MPTIKEIAAKLALSQATVSRALRNDSTLSIASETRTRILTAATEMGYIPKAKQGEKKLQKRQLLVLHKYQTFRKQIDSSYYFTMRTGIEDACAKANVQCSFMAIEELERRPNDIDGVLVIGNFSKEQYDTLLHFFPDHPITAIGIVAYHPERIDHISYSNAASVGLALEYLFQNGHKKIGYLGIEEAAGTKLFGSRRDHFEQIMKLKGDIRPEWILESDHGSDRVVQGYHMMQKLLHLPELPTAIFCANDPLALGAINAILENDMRVPENISILSHDGTYITQHSFPPLTVVDVHPYQLGSEGVELLLRRLAHPVSYTRSLMIYPTLVERDSVKNLNSTK